MTHAEAKEKILQVMCNAAIEAASCEVELSEINRAMIIACEALDKQIPMKAVINTTDKPCFCCPACGNDIWTENHHCKCGQSIDWSDCDA